MAEVHETTWTFLTNHAHVLLAIASEPDLRLRDVAERVGITERAAQRIVAELEAEDYLDVRKVGRRNVYRVHRNRPLRHPAEQHHKVGELLEVLAHDSGGRRAIS
ncbi:MAG: MarR family transcriptional regulator [Actinobacteria bacterium]|nr:MarR family transcriptional regulator [Actinomycetota bacterium]